MKKIIPTLMLAACALGAQAQNATVSAKTAQTEPQKAWTVAVSLETEITDYCSMQMDITMPGVLATTAYTKGSALEAHTLRHSEPSLLVPDAATPNTERVLIFSTAGDAITPTPDTPLFVVSMAPSLAETLEVGDYTLTLTNIRLAHSEGTEDVLDDVTFTIKSGNDDAVIAVNAAADRHADIYNISGRLVRRNARIADLPAGLYIVNGRKVVKQ